MVDGELATLPKAHLHLHFTGGMRHATLLELAAEQGIALPERLVDDEPDDWRLLGWPRFQRLYDLARGVLRGEPEIRRVMREIAEDERAAGSGWVEVQVTPPPYAARLGDLVTAVEVFLSAAADAQAATGIGMGLIVAANRTRPPWEAETLARLAGRYADHGVVGFGLSNDERAAPAAAFAKAFRIAAGHGLAALPHAGELRGADAVAETVEHLAPRRLGHGVRAVEDRRVLGLLAERRIACEVCPASNVALGVYAGHLDVPLRELEAAGVPVVLGADDPLLFGAGLVEQYRVARDVHGCSREDLVRLARTSIDVSLAPQWRKAALLSDLERWERLPAAG
jgi:adenosine deaminase